MPSRVERWNTWPTARPAPFSPSSRASVSIALLPSILISLMLGRSATTTTSTLPSRPMRISSKFPVENRLRAAARMARSSMVSPTATGRAANTLPADIRCRPSTRISEITKAWAEASGAHRDSSRVNTMGMRLVKIHSVNDNACTQDYSLLLVLSSPRPTADIRACYRRAKSLYRASIIIPSTMNSPSW